MLPFCSGVRSSSSLGITLVPRFSLLVSQMTIKDLSLFLSSLAYGRQCDPPVGRGSMCFLVQIGTTLFLYLLFVLGA
jgi:hypothetical protein